MTSARSTSASVPAFLSASTFRSAESRRRPRIAMRAPAAASPDAMLPPRTPYPPVTTATLPSSENGLGFIESSQGEIGSDLESDSGVRRNQTMKSVSYTHLRAHETPEHLVC